MTKRVFIVTGEHSGDLHAAKVVKELLSLNSTLEIEAVGGEALKEAGAKLFKDHRDMAVNGLGAIFKAPHHLKLGLEILHHLQTTFTPDLVLLIDYGGFNLRLSKLLKKNDFKVFYYILPQVWASRKHRLKTIAQNIDTALVILPFEEKIHREAGVNAHYVGHPLVTSISPPVDKAFLCEKYGLNRKNPVISIFPGSRKIEICKILPVLLKTARLIKEKIPEAQFLLSHSPNIPENYFHQYLKKSGLGETLQVQPIKNDNAALLSASDFLLLKSGTVTLEAALYETPSVIVYKSYWVAYYIYLLVRYLEMIGLPNIISGEFIIPEFLQTRAKPELIANEAAKTLTNSDIQEKMRRELAFIKNILTDKNASKEVATIIHDTLSNENAPRKEHTFTENR